MTPKEEYEAFADVMTAWIKESLPDWNRQYTALVKAWLDRQYEGDSSYYSLREAADKNMEPFLPCPCCLTPFKMKVDTRGAYTKDGAALRVTMMHAYLGSSSRYYNPGCMPYAFGRGPRAPVIIEPGFKAMPKWRDEYPVKWG